MTVPASQTVPPRWLRALVGGCIPTEDKILLLDELDTLYAARAERTGQLRASLWYARQASGFIARLGPLSGLGTLDSFPGDVRMACRFLARRPGYVAVFVLTLGIGAGVLSTAYTAANWMLLRPVPGVRNADQLMTLRLGMKGAPAHIQFDLSQPDLVAMRERMPMLTALAGATPVDVDVAAAGDTPARLAGELVTSNYFGVLQTQFTAGRGFVATEETAQPGDNVVVISHDFARQRTSDVAALIGDVLQVNGHAFRIVGVTEPEFRGAELPGRAEIWFPLSALTVLDPTANPAAASNRGAGVWHQMIGRQAAPDITEASVAAANGVMAFVRRAYQGQAHSFMANDFIFQGFAGTGLSPAVRASVRHTLSLVGLTGVFLMLLAIANLTNLTMMQAGAREGAMAIRVALGAGRLRLARGLAIETLILGWAGGGVALILSVLWSRWFEGASLAERGGSLNGMHLEGRVIAATFAMALVAATVAGARQLWNSRPNGFERLLRQSSTRAPERGRLQMSLVAVQVALTLTLVVAAGLLERTVSHLRDIDIGFTTDHLLTYSIEPHLHGYERAQLAQLGADLEERLRSEPGIGAAGFISPSPLSSGYITSALYRGTPNEERPLVGAGFFVTPGFFKTMGINVIAGDRDWRADSGTVALTRSTLRQLYPDVTPEQAIGRMIATQPGGKRPLRVAAIVEDVQLSDITNDPPATLFRPMGERHRGMSVSGFVRTTGSMSVALASVHRAVGTVAPEVPVFNSSSARDAIDRQFAERKVMALAASTLGALGVMLAVVGLYGVLASLVAGRQREIGIRMALGATPSQVRMRVLLSGLRPTAAGVVVGLGGALLMSKLLKAQLYGLSEHDMVTYIGGIGMLLLVAMLTCLVPAWRAARVAPAQVMRGE